MLKYRLKIRVSIYLFLSVGRKMTPFPETVSDPKNMADSKFTFHRLLPLLRWVKTIATWKTVIESMQSLAMDNFRVVFTRFLAFYSDNPSGLRLRRNAGEMAK